MVGFLLCILIVGVCKHLRIWEIEFNVTVQKMKFSIKDFFSKCNQICRSFITELLLRKVQKVLTPEKSDIYCYNFQFGQTLSLYIVCK